MNPLNNERLLRIKEKLQKLAQFDPQCTLFGAAKHKYSLNPKKTPLELESFEAQHNLTLPQEYRDFLIQLGNGGAGPYYGLFSLEEGVK